MYRKKFFSIITIVALLLGMIPTANAEGSVSVSKITLTETVAVNLIKNSVVSDKALFTQDHKTNDNYDSDKVQLIKYTINDLQGADKITLNLGDVYFSNPSTTLLQVWTASNNWTKSGGDFNPVINSPQTLIYQQNEVMSTGSSATHAVKIEFSEYAVETIKNQADETGTITLLVRAINTTPRTSFPHSLIKWSPSLSVEYSTQQVNFFAEKQVVVPGSNPIYVNKSDPTKAAALVSAYGGNNMLYLRSNGTDNILFMTFDLTGLEKGKIESANLETWVFRNGGLQNIKVSEVTTSYNNNDGSYTLSTDNYVISSINHFQVTNPSAVTTSILTDMVKNTNGDSLTVCIQANGDFTSNQLISVSSNYFPTPKLHIKYKENLDSVSELSDYDTVIAERYVVEGTSNNAITAEPIIAAYNNSDDSMAAVRFGNPVTLDGTVKSATASLDITQLQNTSDLSFKFFLFDKQLRPYGKLEANKPIPTGVYVDGVYPNRIYTTTNDSKNSDRNYTLSTYVDYLYNIDTGILFSGGSDHFDYPVITKEMQSSETANTKVKLPLVSDKYYIGEEKFVTQTNTLMSKEMNSPIRLLCIGDSITAGYGTDVKYWQYLQEYFWKESIDFNDPSRNIMLLGTNFIGKNYKSLSRTLTYESVTETLKGYSEGRGGWMLSNYLYHDKGYTGISESHYTAMGGTETFTNSVAQRDYIHSHTLATPNTAAETDNVFYDYTKEGDVKFSINKWLERYRTHDVNGNPLELGKGTGSLINEDNINSYAVCEPTHILIQLGTNDFSYYSEELFRENLWKMVNEIKKELPDTSIIISMTPPALGTYNAALYENCKAPMPIGEGWYRNASYLNEYFKNYDEKANKIYLLPTYFITPTAEAYDSTLEGPELHATAPGHFVWAYQLYSLLKYIQ